RYFLSAVDAGSMTRAAEMHHVAPTALSLQLKLLEEAFGVALLERHARGVTPTPQGVELYQRGRQILDLVSEVEAQMAAAGPRARRVVRLGIPPAIARLIAGQAIMGMARAAPGTELQIVEGWSAELAEQVAAGTLDLVLGYGVTTATGLRGIDLAEERFVLAAAAGMALPDRPLTMAEALDHPLVFYGRRTVAWRAVRDAATALGRVPRILQEVNSIEAWRQLIILGEGVAITPIGAVAEEAAAGRIRICDLAPPGITQRVGLAGRADALADAGLSVVRDYLAALARDRYRELDPNRIVVAPPP
ncbi:LysR family transcriptional regulator, partial [Aphanothece microscopica]|uniref:LysR family transcriptional regulator n=1 Tax=Aphanothece microscopica TaxID=1049561 RepID=UPI0039856168